MAFSTRTRDIVLTGLFAALTAAGAYIKIPLFYVPVTLQTMFTFLAGSLLRPAPAVSSQVIYLLLGLLGIPVFAGGGGIGYLLQPTFGYLAALPIAALTVSSLSRRSGRPPSFCRIFSACMAALAIVYFTGVTWLYVSLRFFAAAPISLTAAIVTGALVFLPADLLKAAAAAALTRSILRRLGQAALPDPL